MVRDTPPSQDASTHQIWNSYLKEYRRYAPDMKRDRRTDRAITICLPKFLWGHKKSINTSLVGCLLSNGFKESLGLNHQSSASNLSFVCLSGFFMSQSTKGRVFLGWSSTKQRLMCLSQVHNAVTMVRFESANHWSQVKHSTTEPLSFLNLGFVKLKSIFQTAHESHDLNMDFCAFKQLWATNSMQEYQSGRVCP